MKVTASALTHVNHMLLPDQYLRIQILAGGCSGFEQKFLVCDHMMPHDVVIHSKVVLDLESDQILQEAELDWCSDLSGDKFVIRIPEATSTCGCGKSFSLF